MSVLKRIRPTDLSVPRCDRRLFNHLNLEDSYRVQPETRHRPVQIGGNDLSEQSARMIGRGSGTAAQSCVCDGACMASRELVFHCQTTSVRTAPCTSRRMYCPTHCAGWSSPCQPLLRAFSGWMVSTSYVDHCALGEDVLTASCIGSGPANIKRATKGKSRCP